MVDLKHVIGVNDNTNASKICRDYSQLYRIAKNITMKS
jgi:hypothetical protein